MRINIQIKVMMICKSKNEAKQMKISINGNILEHGVPDLLDDSMQRT